MRASILTSALILAACSGGKGAASTPKKIETAKISRGSIDRRVLFTGNIAAENSFDVFPRAAGKVSKKLLKEGDPVRRGQPILLVDRDEVGYTYKPLPVVSIADGLVGRIAVDVGTEVDPKTVVATIVQPGSMRVKLDIPERYLGAIVPGMDAEIRVEYLDGEVFRGVVSTRSPVVDHKTRTGRVEIDIPNPEGRLRHGMFGRTLLAVERSADVLIAPLAAISWEGDRQFVYKIDDGKAMRSEVKTGLRDGTNVEITEGAAEGEIIAAGSVFNLNDGEAVDVANGGLDKRE